MMVPTRSIESVISANAMEHMAQAHRLQKQVSQKLLFNILNTYGGRLEIWTKGNDIGAICY